MSCAELQILVKNLSEQVLALLQSLTSKFNSAEIDISGTPQKEAKPLTAVSKNITQIQGELLTSPSVPSKSEGSFISPV